MKMLLDKTLVYFMFFLEKLLEVHLIYLGYNLSMAISELGFCQDIFFLR